MNGSSLQSRRILSARRIALLATTVAGIGAAAFLLRAEFGDPFRHGGAGAEFDREGPAIAAEARWASPTSSRRSSRR